MTILPITNKSIYNTATLVRFARLEGAPGADGEDGEDGDIGPIGPIGPTGPAGETGPQGEQGIQGERGDRGLRGFTGATGATGPQGPQGEFGERGETGAAGADGLEPNHGFLITEQTTESVTAVAADSSTDEASGYWSWNNNFKQLRYYRIATSPTNKFNFYTHSTESLNNLTIGRLASLQCEFTCRDYTTFVDRPEVKLFMVVYTTPKGDGTDRASWYNSRITIGESPTDEFIVSETNYNFGPAHFINGATLLSTSYGNSDTILTVNVSSNSSEPEIGWVFQLFKLRVYFSGPDGPDGADGAPGADGADGAPGPQGPQGETGDIGPQGIQGPQGEQGPIGPEGPEGPQGPIGPVGATGSEGPVGPQGIQGPQGDQGPAGPEGPQGPIGPEGPQGPIGPEGPIGATGSEGPQGIQGIQGETGPQGPEGPEGPEGPLVPFVGFNATMNRPAFILNGGDVIPFDIITYNLHTGTYDTGTYKYTVPEDGVYLITLRLTYNQPVTQASSIGIYKNAIGDPIYRNGKSSGNSENIITTCYCTAGDTYYCKVTSGQIFVEAYRPWTDWSMSKLNGTYSGVIN